MFLTERVIFICENRQIFNLALKEKIKTKYKNSALC